MSEHDADPAIEAARTAATAAGTLLAEVNRVEHAVADPLHTRLQESLAALMPACQTLASSFPEVRGRVAGLVYQSVKYRGYEGSSALHVASQMAELILEAGERWLQGDNLSADHLDLLAEELDRALPSSLNAWLRNHLDTELSALERQLGVRITEEFHRLDRPRPLARIERMISPYTVPPGEVVYASGAAPVSVATPPEALKVEFMSEKLALVVEGSTTVEIRGERRVWLFKQVEAADRHVTWWELVEADMLRAAEWASTDVDSSNPRMATSPASFQRAGNHIRTRLGKLAYHWHQDGQGARWSSEVS